MDKVIREFPVTVYGNLTKYSDTISKARVRIFYRGINRNGTFISDEFAEKLLDTIPYSPIKGIFEEEDFSDHGNERAMGRIYGIVPENPNLQWENHIDDDGVMRQYACVDVLLYTALYEEAAAIPGKSQSMELYAPSIKGDWENIEGKRLFKYTDACFLGLQVLGDKVEPCFEGAAFFSYIQEQFKIFCKELEKFGYKLPENNEGGGQLSMKVNFKLSDGQKHDILFSLLNTNYNEEGNWTITYSINDVYDEYAVCYNYELQQYERVYYTKNDDSDEVTIGDRIKCYILDVTENEKKALEALQQLNGGSFELVDENFEKVEDHEQKVTELNASIATLEQEKGELSQKLEEANTSIETLTNENVTLNSYKEEKEKAEKKAVIESYSEVLDEAVLESFAEKIDDYTVEELDKEMAYTLKKTNISVFSGKGVEVIPKDNPLTGIEAILSKY